MCFCGLSYLNASENCIPACGRTFSNDQETIEIVFLLIEFTMGRRMTHSTKMMVPQSTDTNPFAGSRVAS